MSTNPKSAESVSPRIDLHSGISRRTALQSGLLAVGAALGASAIPASGGAAEPAPKASPDANLATKLKVKQSVMAWCFKPLPMEQLIAACAEMGLAGMEGISEEYYPLMKEHGLAVSLCGSHGFTRGPVNPENHDHCIEKLRAAIDRAEQWNCKHVITFTGMSEKHISAQQSFDNCVACWKQVMGYAEDKGITLVLEHLNSRDDTHPMKGHPGYFGDDVDQCIEMIRAVDSPNMKLLFDIYHVQIMNGDVIRRFRQYHELIGHVHTAGVPGRGELDETQELNYPAIIRSILATGYEGYITQEFIPTWDDKIASLKHGVMTCEVE